MAASSVKIWDLPDEILRLIFSKLTTRDVLTRVMDVCTRWKTIIEQDFTFWKHLQLIVHCDIFINRTLLYTQLSDFNRWFSGENNIYIGEGDLVKLSKLRSIKLEGGHSEKRQPALLLIRVLDIIRKSCKDIKKVECNRCFGATSPDFLQFLNDCYSNLCEIKFGMTSVWRIPYEELLNFRNLNTIISFDYRFKRSDLQLITDGCEQLTSLWILFARSVKSDDINNFLDKKKRSLRELGVGFSVTDSVLEKVKDCHNLNVLFIFDARRISEEGLKHVTNLSSLKYISFHRATFNPEFLIDWVYSSTVPSQLAILDLTDYYFKKSCSIHQIAKRCPVTFSNEVANELKELNKPVMSQVHWMYCNVVKHL